MLIVSPVCSSTRATPTSLDAPEIIDRSCCSRLVNCGEEAACTGCSAKVSSPRKAIMKRIGPLPANGCAPIRVIAKSPHSFQIVKISNLGSEKMHDDVIGVYQNPVRRGEAFDPGRLAKLLLDPLRQLRRHGGYLPRRAAGCDDHVVSDVGFAG